MYAHLGKLFMTLVFVLCGAGEAATHTAPRHIYGGYRATFVNTTFMAIINVQHRYCGSGALANRETVIASSYCGRQDTPSNLRIFVGVIHMKKEQGYDLPVFRVHFHPDYKPNSPDSDIAIYRIGHRNYSSDIWRFGRPYIVRKIHIPKSNYQRPEPYSYATVFGFGKSELTNTGEHEQITAEIQNVTLMFHIMETCKQVYSFMPQTSLCASAAAGGPARNDHGAPLVIDFTLIGVYSYGPDRNHLDTQPSIFTYVPAFREWIDDILWSVYQDSVDVWYEPYKPDKISSEEE